MLGGTYRPDFCGNPPNIAVHELPDPDEIIRQGVCTLSKPGERIHQIYIKKKIKYSL